jgi:peptide/nickel transport system substrate-binding protein
MYDHDAGSGPYVLEEWEHGVSLSVVQNPNYWDPERPKDVERFTVLYIAERATDQLLLERGEIDALGFPVVDLIPVYEANPDIDVGQHDSFKGMNIMMNALVPPLDDLEVRKAISLAFDYQAIIDGVFQGYALQAQGPISRRMPFHDFDLPMYEQDIEKAKEVLAAAGYPDGGGLELEMIVITGYTPWIGAAQVLQQSLAQIGITLKITEMPWTQMAARGQNRDNPLQIYVINEFPAYPDPDSTMYTTFHTSQQEVGWNLSFYGDEETDALIDKGRFSVDPAEREAAYMELQRRLFEDHAAIWMVNEQVISARRNWVENYDYDPTWHETFRPDLIVLEGKP